MQPTLPEVRGSHVDRETSQFYTPDPIARRMAKWANVADGDLVFEPSAGRGALIKALDDLSIVTRVWAWDIDPVNCAELRQLSASLERVRLQQVYNWDYLRLGPTHPDDMPALALMNPPYEGNQDIKFVERALGNCRRVVGIFQSRIVHSKGRSEFWRMHDIQRLAFLSERPHFGGEHSAKTDFVVMELVRRKHRRNQGEATPAQVEWWT